MDPIGAVDRNLLHRQLPPAGHRSCRPRSSQPRALRRAHLTLGGAAGDPLGGSFIGADGPPTSLSWVSIVADGRDYVLSGNWWLTTFPGLAIAVSVLAINFFGDGLRDVLDPRLRLKHKSPRISASHPAESSLGNLQRPVDILFGVLGRDVHLRPD